MLGLGVFGIVDVTVDGVVAVGGILCIVTAAFWLFWGLRAILKLFSLRRPFVLKCIASVD